MTYIPLKFISLKHFFKKSVYYKILSSILSKIFFIAHNFTDFPSKDYNF